MTSGATAAARSGDETADATPAAQTRHFGGVARDGALNLVGAGISAVLNVAITVVVTRGFDRRAAGVFFTATSVFLLAYTVARLGTATGAVFFVSRYRRTGQQHRLRASLRVASFPVVATSVVLAALLFGFAPQVSGRILRGGGDDAVAALRVLAVFIPFAAVSDLALAAARGFARMRPLVLVEKIGRPLAQTLLVGTVVLVGASAQVALPAAWVSPYVASALVSWLWLGTLRRAAERRAGLPPGPVTRAEAGEFWRFTAPRALGSIAQIGLQRLDIILVAALAGPVPAAVYTAATRFLVVGQLGGTAISTAVQHRFGELLAVGDRTGTNRLYQFATSWLMLLLWPVYLLFAVFSGSLLAVFGSGYAVGRSVMVLLALSMLVATAAGSVDNVLNMAGRTTWTLGNAALALAIDVGLDLLLIPHLGILGAAIGWSAAILANNVLPVAQLGWSMRLHPFGRATFAAAALAGGCFGVIPLAALLVAGDRLAVLVAAAVAGAVLYAGLLWRCREVLQLGALRALRRRPA
jgi:O-antigen/teichoic acid export membrane protein